MIAYGEMKWQRPSGSGRPLVGMASQKQDISQDVDISLYAGAERDSVEYFSGARRCGLRVSPCRPARRDRGPMRT